MEWSTDGDAGSDAAVPSYRSCKATANDQSQPRHGILARPYTKGGELPFAASRMNGRGAQVTDVAAGPPVACLPVASDLHRR